MDSVAVWGDIMSYIVFDSELRLPQPPLSILCIRPPNVRHARKRTHPNDAIIHRNVRVLSLQRLNVQRRPSTNAALVATKDHTRERCTNECTEPTDEVERAVDARVVPRAVELGDCSQHKCVIAASENAIHNSERREARTRGCGPECEDRDSGEEALEAG